MENISKTVKVFPWQNEAMQLIKKRTGNNASAEIRIALSKYIEKYFVKPIAPDQQDMLHYKARSIFERKKKIIKK